MVRVEPQYGSNKVQSLRVLVGFTHTHHEAVLTMSASATSALVGLAGIRLNWC